MFHRFTLSRLHLKPVVQGRGLISTQAAVVSQCRLLHSALTLPRPTEEEGMAGKAVPYDENRHDNARRDMEERAVPQTMPYESLEGDDIADVMRDVPSKNEGNYEYRGLVDEPFWKRDYIERRHEDAAVKMHDQKLLQTLWAKNKKMTEKYWSAKTMTKHVTEGPYRIEEGDGDEIAKDLEQVESLANDIEMRLKDIDEKLSKYEKIWGKGQDQKQK